MDAVIPMVLDNRLGAAEKSARHIMDAHDEAMICLDVENLIDEVIGIHQMIQKDLDRLHPTGTAPADSGRVWHRVYQRLDECISLVGVLAERMERLGFRIARRSALVDLAREVRSITSVSFDRVRDAMDSVGKSDSRSLAEVMRELRGRP